MRGILFFVFGLGILLVAGCSQKIAPSTTIAISDSVKTREVPRIIYEEVPGKTVTVTEYIKCDSVTNRPVAKEIKARSEDGAIVDVDIMADGSITATGGCDSLKLKLEVTDKIIEHLRSENSKTVQPVIIHTPYWYDVMCRWIAGISVLTVAAYIVFKLYIKPYFKIL